MYKRQAQQSAALVDGFQLAFYVAAGLFVVGTIVVATLLRRSDVALIDETAGSPSELEAEAGGQSTEDRDAVPVPA